MVVLLLIAAPVITWAWRFQHTRQLVIDWGQRRGFGVDTEEVGPAWVNQSMKRLGLAPFREVTAINCYRLHLTDAELAILNGLPRLEGLRLEGTGATAAGLDHLSPVSAFEYIGLGGPGYAGDDLDRLQRFTHLSLVWLESDAFDPANLAHLTVLPRLTLINFEDSTIRWGEALQHLHAMPSLRNIFIAMYADDAAGLDALRSLPDHVGVWLTLVGADDRTIRALQDMDGLRELRFEASQGVTDAGIASLVDLPRLENLYLSQTFATPVSMSSLMKMPALKRLDLHDTGMAVNDFLDLGKAKRELVIDGMTQVQLDRMRVYVLEHMSDQREAPPEP